VQIDRIGAAAHLGGQQRDPVPQALATHVGLRVDDLTDDVLVLRLGEESVGPPQRSDLGTVGRGDFLATFHERVERSRVSVLGHWSLLVREMAVERSAQSAELQRLMLRQARRVRLQFGEHHPTSRPQRVVGQARTTGRSAGVM
jgi:hypothetical protein